MSNSFHLQIVCYFDMRKVIDAMEEQDYGYIKIKLAKLIEEKGEKRDRGIIYPKRKELLKMLFQ